MAEERDVWLRENKSECQLREKRGKRVCGKSFRYLHFAWFGDACEGVVDLKLRDS